MCFNNTPSTYFSQLKDFAKELNLANKQLEKLKQTPCLLFKSVLSNLMHKHRQA